MCAKTSEIQWPAGFTAIPEMTYEAIEPLYVESHPDVFGEQIGLILSCSKHFSQEPRGCKGCLHKLEVIASPNFAQANMKLTHEVLPNLASSAQIIRVNERLKVAGFNRGSIVPIKNFGFKKTFNCDVRARLSHHTDPVNCLASDSLGQRLASGSTCGEIALYDVREDEISFISRKIVASTFITGLAFLRPDEDICLRPDDRDVLDGENVLLYSTQCGDIGMIDARCKLGDKLKFRVLDEREPRMNISALCPMPGLSGQQVFFGTDIGQLFSIDLRYSRGFVFQRDFPEDGWIRRMKRVTVVDSSNRTKIYVAYTNNSENIRILNATTMEPDENWKCDREPKKVQRDLCKVGNRIVTCGDKTSIGCWVYENQCDKKP